MLWRITCYNGTEWEPKGMPSLITAIQMFMHETGLTELDIKKIENLH